VPPRSTSFEQTNNKSTRCCGACRTRRKRVRVFGKNGPRNFRNLGNRYRHYYDNIDVERVYEDVQMFIPQVQRAVIAELPLARIGDEPPARPRSD